MKLTEVEVLESRRVTIYLFHAELLLEGDWEWDFHSQAVFCSEVMSFPDDFPGTKGIIHPEDAEALRSTIHSLKANDIVNFQFRIITTYGVVKYLKGDNISVLKKNAASYCCPDLYEQAVKEKYFQSESERWKLKQHVMDVTERIMEMGTWFTNTRTNETWYSDQMFRIYSIPPQSLNNHLNTFYPFLHPEDKMMVTEAIDRAFLKNLPLHLEHRIITADGKVKQIKSITSWFYNERGDLIQSGLVQDITELNKTNEEVEQLQNELDFQKQVILLDELETRLGHWNMNLLTRKLRYSDNYFRIFGLKPKSVQASFNAFLNFIHPEDRERMMIERESMTLEHAPREMQYRIIQADGKIRYIKEKTKIINISGELILMGMIQDINYIKHLENRSEEHSATISLRNYSLTLQEEMAGTGNWIWELETGEIEWSDGIFHILGFKPNSVELSQSRFVSFVYPEDRNNFRKALNEAIKEKREDDLEFRIMASGSIKYIKASFRLMTINNKVYFVGILYNNTNERLLQKDMDEKQSLTRSLIDGIEDRVFITDINNDVILWNRECERFFRIKQEHVLYKNVFEVFSSFKNQQTIDALNKTLAGEKIFLSHSFSPFSKDSIDLLMIPLKNSEDKVEGVLHKLHDLTKELKLQQCLLERNSLLESLSDASLLKVIALDKNMNYILWNSKCEEYYGISRDVIIGKNIMEVFPGLGNGPGYDDFRKALKGENVHLQFNNKASEGVLEEMQLIPVKNQFQEVIAILWIIYETGIIHPEDEYPTKMNNN